MLNFIREALRTTGLLKGGFDTDEPICRNRDTEKENGLVDTEWRRRGWDEVKEQHRHICAALLLLRRFSRVQLCATP